MALFQPITSAPQPAPPNFVDDRRVPPPAHLAPSVEPYRAELIPRAYLPPPEDPYRSTALQAPSHLPSLEDPYRSHAHPALSHLPPPEDPYRLPAYQAPSRLPPPEDPYRFPAYQAPSQLPPPEDPYRSRRHLAPVHLPTLEEKYLGRVPATSDSRYISAHALPTANDPYHPEERYARAPLSVAHATDPYYRPSSGYYQQAEVARAYYPENPVLSERYVICSIGSQFIGLSHLIFTFCLFFHHAFVTLVFETPFLEVLSCIPFYFQMKLKLAEIFCSLLCIYLCTANVYTKLK